MSSDTYEQVRQAASVKQTSEQIARIAAIFDVALYAYRYGTRRAFLMVRTRDRGVILDLQKIAGGTISTDAGGVHYWYGSLKDKDLYAQVYKQMQADKRRAKLGEVFGFGVANAPPDKDLATTSNTSTGDNGQGGLSDELVNQLKFGRPKDSPKSEAQVVAEKEFKYRRGVRWKDMRPEELAEVKRHLQSKAVVRLGVKTWKLVAIVAGPKDHTPEIVEAANRELERIKALIREVGPDRAAEIEAAEGR